MPHQQEKVHYKAEIRESQGTPTIFVNGEPYHFGAVAAACYRQELPSLLAGTPASICLLEPPESQTVGERPDLESLGNRVDKLVRQFPKALFGCIFHLAPARSWIVRHPKEMTVYDLPIDELAEKSSGRLPEPSWASEQWQKDSAKHIGAIAAFLHKEFDGKVILYQVGSGKCGENFPNVDPVAHGQWYCSDFSIPMIAWFRRWLEERYDHDTDQLRTAWSDSAVNFDHVQIPDRQARLRSDWFSFRSPLLAQVSDYYRAWSQSIEQCVVAWAKAVKEATDGESLTASPMGSVLDCGLNADAIQHLMKNTFERCLDSPYLDMFQSPASYVLRDLGRGDTSSMIPLGTLRLNGKMWLRDFDSRTRLATQHVAQDLSSELWKAPQTSWEDEQLLKRDSSYSLLKGGAWWWHEIVKGMYGSAEHTHLAKKIERLAQVLLHVDRRPMPGLAVITDHQSNFHLSNSNRLIFAMNYEARRLHWTHAGVASETYCLDDVTNPQITPHKVVMVTNVFDLSEPQADRIKQMARDNAATLIWLVAPGVVTEQGFDTHITSRIVEMPIRAVNIEAQPTIKLLDTDHSWSNLKTADGQNLSRFGVGPLGKDDSGSRAVGPLFYADVEPSDKVHILGLVETLAKPGLVVKEDNGLTTVYCSAPYIHHALLHAIARDAGAHVLTPCGDLVHACNQLVLTQATCKGRKTLQLPHEADIVCDLFEGKLICENSPSASFDLEHHEVKFLYTGPRDIIQRYFPGVL